MTVYYNEFDSHAADWLENLIREGVIAHGIVDRRDIRDVKPRDLDGFTQCHLFAGIGVWSYALRQAGWPDSRRVWTGSCPCPPFSAAGKKKSCPECGSRGLLAHVGRTGFFACCDCGHEWLADDRHLWPEMWRLIRDGKPPVFFGEQVASADGVSWMSLVRASLEILAYDVGCGDFPAAGVGAPHIRQRLFFVGHSERIGAGRHAGTSAEAERGATLRPVRHDAGPSSTVGELAHTDKAGSSRQSIAGLRRPELHDSDRCGELHRLADTQGVRLLGRSDERDGGRWERTSGQGRETGELEHAASDGREQRRPEPSERSVGGGCGESLRSCPVNGFWRDADWLGCTDGKWRPVEPGTQPLVDGAAFRLGSGGSFESKSRAKMLKGYGNGIVSPVAEEFIRAYMAVVGPNLIWDEI